MRKKKQKLRDSMFSLVLVRTNSIGKARVRNDLEITIIRLLIHVLNST